MWTLWLVAFACDETTQIIVGDDTGTATPASDDTDTTEQDQQPVIEGGTIRCSEGSNSSGYIFYVEVDADDPQGKDTLAPGGLVAGWNATDDLVFEDAILNCNSDGWCMASFRDEIYTGVNCANHNLYTYTAQIIDEDDNLSERFQLIWTD